jgi:hypothetical protein
MPVGQAEEITALALVFAVHVIGLLMLLWALLDTEQRAGWRRRWSRGDDGPEPPSPPPPGPAGTPAAVGARPPLPLPDAAASTVRLREPLRVADGYPRPARRPAHEPKPQRAPVPERHRQRR